MNSITPKMLLIAVALLSSACVHYPPRYSYYPGNNAYSSGYTIMHRNYYGERPEHYDNGYGPGNDYFPHRRRHDQYNALPRWNNDFQGPRQQHDRSYAHPYNDENRHRHNDDSGSRHHNFDRRNRY